MVIIIFIVLFGSLSGIFYTFKFLKARPLLSRKFWFVVIPFILILSPIFVFIAIKQGFYFWYYRNKPAPAIDNFSLEAGVMRKTRKYYEDLIIS